MSRDSFPWGIVAAGTFGEQEVGLATKNRGENSTEDASETGLAGMKEQGDSPEQLKDTQGMGHDPDQSGQTDEQHGGDLSSSAMKAFHQNLELIQEYADSPISGKDHPLLSALDQMLEEAFPGYRDGHEGHEEATDQPGAGPEPHGDLETEEQPEKRLAGLGDDPASQDIPGDGYADGGTPYSDEELGYPADWEALCKYADRMAKKLAQSWNTEVYGSVDDVGLEDAIQYMQSEPGMATGGFPEMSGEAWETLASFFIETLRDTANLDSGQTDTTFPEHWTAGVKESIPGSVGQGYGVPTDGVGVGGMPVPDATAAPACPTCGVAHAPGTPCAGTAMPGQENPAMGAGSAAGNMMYRQPLTPPRPQSVVTHEKGAASVDYDDEQEMVPRRQNDEHHDNRYEDGLDGANEGWYEHWDGPEKDKEPWVDDAGSTLIEGQQYELHSSKYAIPDRITVESVTPHKLTFQIHSGDVDYRDELTPDDMANYGYSFQAPKDGSTDSESGFPLEDENPQPAPEQRSPLNLTQPQPRAAAVDGMTTPADQLPPCTNCMSHPFEHGTDGTCPGGMSKYTLQDTNPPETYPTQDRPAFTPPVRPGADPQPQVDDLSTPTTKQGVAWRPDDDPNQIQPARHPLLDSGPRTNADLPCQQCGQPHIPGTPCPTGADIRQTVTAPTDYDDNGMMYTGSFRGDDTDSRSWLMSGGSTVEVDQATMAKVAGKDFSPQEQRDLINEEGVGGPARNLETRMDLAGTHYEFQDDPYADALW